MDTLTFSNANSRDTYFTVHNVKAAHRYARGKGVKVGIIDHGFALDGHTALYAGGVDMVGDLAGLHEEESHGFWMATALREIAPECDIIAINGMHWEEGMSREEFDERRIQHLIQSVEWAIASGMDILTHSGGLVRRHYRQLVGDALAKAAASGVATTFIHIDHPDNIWPHGCFPYDKDKDYYRDFTREPDVNIYHQDYNTIMVDRCRRYLEMTARGEEVWSGDTLPFFSNSSMSPVLAGFDAILRSIRPQLTPGQCRELLISTSYPITEEGEHWFDLNPCPRVVDIGKAVTALL